VKRTVTLDIAGARYRLSTDADEGHLKGLASIVNERIAQLGPKAQRSAAPAQLLAVVALGLVEDLQEAERRRGEVESVARATINRAIERIDLRLSEDAELARRVTKTADPRPTAPGARAARGDDSDDDAADDL
jgi:cell division protein ZapA (FtsZ GTPase activity inhibitor)